MKLVTRGIIGITLIIGLVLIFIGVVMNFTLRDYLIAEKLSDLESLAELQEWRLEQVIEKDLERINGVTSRTQLRISLEDYNVTGNPEAQIKITDIISDARDSISDFRNISIVNPEGNVVASTGGLAVGDNVAGQDYFSSAQGADYISPIVEGPEGDPTMYLSGPLIMDDQFLGVAVMETDPENILKVTTEYISAFGKTGETVLARTDNNGNIDFFAPRRFEEDRVFEPGEREKGDESEPMTGALGGEEKTYVDSLDYRGVEVYAASRYLETTGWGVVVKIDASQVLEMSYFLQRLYIYIAIAALFVGIVAAYLLSRSITSSVNKLQASAAKIAAGDLSQPIKLKDKSR